MWGAEVVRREGFLFFPFVAVDIVIEFFRAIFVVARFIGKFSYAQVGAVSGEGGLIFIEFV